MLTKRFGFRIELQTLDKQGNGYVLSAKTLYNSAIRYAKRRDSVRAAHSATIDMQRIHKDSNGIVVAQLEQVWI